MMSRAGIKLSQILFSARLGRDSYRAVVVDTTFSLQPLTFRIAYRHVGTSITGLSFREEYESRILIVSAQTQIYRAKI